MENRITVGNFVSGQMNFIWNLSNLFLFLVLLTLKSEGLEGFYGKYGLWVALQSLQYVPEIEGMCTSN